MVQTGVIRLWVLLDCLNNCSNPISLQKCIENLQTASHFLLKVVNQSTDTKYPTWKVLGIFTSPFPNLLTTGPGQQIDLDSCFPLLWSKGTMRCLFGDESAYILLLVWYHIRKVLIWISSVQCSLLLKWPLIWFEGVVWLVTWAPKTRRVQRPWLLGKCGSQVHSNSDRLEGSALAGDHAGCGFCFGHGSMVDFLWFRTSHLWPH